MTGPAMAGARVRAREDSHTHRPAGNGKRQPGFVRVEVFFFFFTLGASASFWLSQGLLHFSLGGLLCFPLFLGSFNFALALNMHMTVHEQEAANQVLCVA